MATLASLVEQGFLIPFRPRLVESHRVWRRLWLRPSVIDWLEAVVFDASSFLGNKRRPYEQFDDLMEEFCAGISLNLPRDFHVLRPAEQSVWELKTDELRLFGFFPGKNEFVIVFGDFADRVKDHDLYAGYRNETVRLRDQMNLTSYIKGHRYDDVLSDAP